MREGERERDLGGVRKIEKVGEIQTDLERKMYTETHRQT